MVRVSSSGVGRVESGSGGRVNARRAALRADTGGMREGKGMCAAPRPVRDPGDDGGAQRIDDQSGLEVERRPDAPCPA